MIIKIKRECSCGSQYYNKYYYYTALVIAANNISRIKHNFQCVECGKNFSGKGYKFKNV